MASAAAAQPCCCFLDIRFDLGRCIYLLEREIWWNVMIETTFRLLRSNVIGCKLLSLPLGRGIPAFCKNINIPSRGRALYPSLFFLSQRAVLTSNLWCLSEKLRDQKLCCMSIVFTTDYIWACRFLMTVVCKLLASKICRWNSNVLRRSLWSSYFAQRVEESGGYPIPRCNQQQSNVQKTNIETTTFSHDWSKMGDYLAKTYKNQDIPAHKNMEEY